MKMWLASVTIKSVFTAAILATSISCGSQNGPTGPSSFAPEPRAIPPEPSPIPPPGWSNTVPAANAGVPGVSRFDVAMSRSGTAVVTLRWPNADFSLQLYVTRGECTDTSSLVTGACTILGTTRPGTLPGVITSAVVSGDAVTVWVLNPDEVGPQPFTVDLGIN